VINLPLINIGTYPPKQCGIATFSMDLRNSLIGQGNNVKIMAISDEGNEYMYSNDVVFNIKQDQKQDYIKAAKYFNSAPDLKLAILQHEYGIFGGKDGEYVMEMVRLFNKPFILITHTVLPRPSKQQKEILNYLCHRAAAIVCMTRSSAALLADLYEAPPETINIIAHGVPEFERKPAYELKLKYHLHNKQVITTFGLIGPGKGLELGIKAIAKVIADFPETIFLILGQTHPMLKKREGEKYRHMLENMVTNLGLDNNVKFVNKYLSDEEIGEYLYMSDIYLSPYPNKDQAVSGTMAFAVGCGRAIVSTSYAYAREVLEGNRGLLAKEADPQELADLIKTILSDSKLQHNLQSKALELGKTWTWPSIGQQYTQLISKILDDHLLRKEETFYYAGF